jgi:hypothetical protein
VEKKLWGEQVELLPVDDRCFTIYFPSPASTASNCG